MAHRRWRWLAGNLLGPALVAALVTGVLAFSQSISTEAGLSGAEREALGWMLIHRPSRPVDSRIAFVAVDTALYEEREASLIAPETPPGKKPLKQYGPPGCACPYVPRECYRLAVERLHRWGASAVVLDIMFRSPGFSPADVRETQRLGDALFAANNVVVAAPMTALALDRTRDPTRTSDVVLDPPTPAIAENAYVGSPKIDPRDQEYTVELLQTAHGSGGEMHDFYSMPYLAYCVATGHPQEELGRWRRRWVDGTAPLLLGNLSGSSRKAPKKAAAEQAPPEDGVQLITSGNVVVDQAFYQKRLVINYACGADAEKGRFHPARLSWLLSCSDREGRERFNKKVVLIGDPAQDLHRTVVGALPGTEVLANAVQTLLEDRPIVPAPPRFVLLLMFCAAWLAATAVRKLSALAAGLLVGLEVAGLGALSILLLQNDVWLLVASPIAAVVVTAGVAFFLASRVGQGMVARLIPARISRTLEQVGGFRVEEGTVMFSDIRGYSTFSEYMDPAEMMSRLNAYFATVQEVLDRYDGHFIKSPGDCVVAWFSEEKHGEHHTDRAIRAAIELVMNAVRFRRQWPAGDGTPFDIGVGINTGPMAVGILDARRHIEPTIIGDTVNLASRIESLTKQYHAAVIVSEETLAPVRERFIYEALGVTAVKGRSQEVRIYRIIGIAPGAEMERKPRWWEPRRQRVNKEALMFRIPGSPDEPEVPAAPPRDPAPV